jgi:hypothetical protein
MDDQRTDRESGRVRLPRFRLKSLLIIMAVTGLWFSTFARYVGSEDVQQLVILVITILPGAAAFSATGSPRWFWGGFCAAMVALGSKTLFNVGPRFSWLFPVSNSLSRYISKGPASGKANAEFIQVTLALLLWTATATLIGLLCAYVYKQSQSEKT